MQRWLSSHYFLVLKVITYREGDEKGTAVPKLYESIGFTEGNKQHI